MPATPQAPKEEGPDDWSITDAIALREFMMSNPKFMRVLESRRPKIEGHTMESRAVTGSDVNGFLVCIDAIKALQRDPNAGQEEPGFVE